MKTQAVAKLRALGSRELRLVRGDAFKLPFPDGSFAGVVSLNFLHMFRFDLQQEVVGEMTRVCRRGGTLVVELGSIHRGLVVSRYLEQRSSRSHTKFNRIAEVRRLFPPGAVQRQKVVGTLLPGAHRVLKYAPRVGLAIEAITYAPPFNWLASRVFVVGRQVSGVDTVSRLPKSLA